MLPILTVSGFLGSGKTSLVKNLLVAARDSGVRMAVVVNEFGAVDIDTPVLRAAQIEVLAAVAGGCACCAGQDDFIEALQDLATRPDGERPEAVVVEASGLADPVLLLEIMSGPQLVHLVNPALFVAVADAANWNDRARELGPLLRNQIELADFLVLNKTDLASVEAVAALGQRLAELNPRAEITRTVHGELNFAPLLETLFSSGLSHPARDLWASKGVSVHAHGLFSPLPHPVIRNDLEALLAKLPTTVWRAKGFLRLRGEPGLQLVQYTGGQVARWHIGPFHAPFGDAEPELGLVLLGAGMEADGLLRLFRELSLGAAY